MISIAKYLNALGPDYMMMHDRDANTPGAAAMNDPILEQTGPNRRIMLEECIEDILGYAPPAREKPYTAYRHIIDNWGGDFIDLPEQWREIFIRLCSPWIDHLRE